MDIAEGPRLPGVGLIHPVVALGDEEDRVGGMAFILHVREGNILRVRREG